MTPTVHTIHGTVPADTLYTTPEWQFVPDENGNLAGVRFELKYFDKTTNEQVRNDVYLWQRDVGVTATIEQG